MSPFNPDKFRLDTTAQGGVNGSIDRKIEKLSKKCAELIQKNKHKDAKKILTEIKDLKALRLPEDSSDLESTLITTPVLPVSDSTLEEMEKTLATTPLILDQEKTVVSPPQEIQKIPQELANTVVTMPFNPNPNSNPNPNPDPTSSENSTQEPVLESKNKGTMIGIGICVITFFVMAFFSFFAFKDFPGKGSYFDWLRAESVYQKAEAERNEGSFDQAIANYEEANKIYPELAKAADARGWLQLFKGDEKTALSSFEDAAFNNPKNSKFQRDYANALRRNNQEVKALEVLTKQDPKDASLQQSKALLALIQLRLNQPEADATLREATSNSNIANAERDYYAGIFYRHKGDLSNSIECFKRATKAEPLNVVYLVDLITTKEMKEEDATQEASDYTKIAPKWVGSWNTYAVQNESQKKYAEAAENYVKAARLDPKNSDRCSRAAQAYLKAGKNADALRMANEGLKLRTCDFVCLDVISKADESATPQKMEELYQKALSEVSDYAFGWSSLALYQSKQEGKLMQALESQAKALKLDPKSASDWYQLALYLDLANNKKEALRAAAEAMSLEPENEKYTDLRMKLMSNN